MKKRKTTKFENSKSRAAQMKMTQTMKRTS
jgi:hypothetical protein